MKIARISGDGHENMHFSFYLENTHQTSQIIIANGICVGRPFFNALFIHKCYDATNLERLHYLCVACLTCDVLAIQ